MRLTFLLFAIVFSLACGNSPVNNGSAVKTPAAKTPSAPLPVSTYEVVRSYPHDPKAFTEGLFFYNGFLFESTGEEGESSLRKIELDTGKIVKRFDLPREDFGEGSTVLNNKIFMVTWRQGLGRVFDADSFALLREFPYQGEGWGMTNDGTNLYLTQGTHVIKVIDPETFKTVRTLPVRREDGRPLMQLNELEFIKGELWANIWHSESPQILGKPNFIARINSATGDLLGWVDLSGISPDDRPDPKNIDDFGDPKAEHTLNGIAYDAKEDRIFVTGKNWKKLYEIKVKPAAN